MLHIGCDVVEIARFKELVKNPLFLKKYFTANEMECIKTKTNKVQTIAGMYAAKEAFLKALKIGIGGGIRLCDVEVLHANTGFPFIPYNEKINYYLERAHLCQIDVSISHEKDYAFAVCIIK